MFVRSKPSQVKNWQAKVENTDAHVVYKNEVTRRNLDDEDPVEQEVLAKPRNVEQLRNLKRKINKQQRLSWDEVYNVHEMALDMDSFVRHITTFPDMVIICGLKQILEEMELVIGDGSINQLLSYDTKFTIGDFYHVSILIFRHTFLVKNPCILALFLVHEKKYEECHQKLFHMLDKLVKFPRVQQIACVTDGERGIVNAVKSLPQLLDVRCWNHVFNDIKAFVTKNGGQREEAKVYKNNVKKIRSVQKPSAITVHEVPDLTFCPPENIIEGLKNKTFTTGPTDGKMDVPLSRAEEIIKSGKLLFSPQLGNFTVIGFSDVPRVVRLYPNEYCSCGVKTTCYHKIAVKRKALA